MNILYRIISFAEIYHHIVQPGEPNAFPAYSAYFGSSGKGAP
jgi:hypothetical protein